MNRRLTDGIVQGFLDYTNETEVPDVFSFWTAVATVSAALGRDCFFDMGHFDIFPNMYIVLVAGSAVCRKSTAISIANKFVKKIEPSIHILSQKMTPEAMIGALSGMEAKGETMIVNEASGIIIVDELATLVDKNAFQSGMIPLLTKLYDCDDFSYLTKSRGEEHVRNPCLSILGGSTLAWIKGSVPPVAIGGGFTSRVVFVYKETNNKLDAFPKLSAENKKRWETIASDLNLVAKMRGGFAIEAQAKEALTQEYKNFMLNSQLLANPQLSGYAGRRHTTMIKLCMALSAARSDSRLIEMLDVNIAIKAMSTAEQDMPRVLQAISSEFVGDAVEEVYNYIKKSQTIPRAELIRKTRWRLTVRHLDIIIETLFEAKLITINKEGTEVSYEFLGVKK